MLNMKGVSKVYRTESVETHALREFSLAVEEGEFVSVTGPSVKTASKACILSFAKTTGCIAT